MASVTSWRHLLDLVVGEVVFVFVFVVIFVVVFVIVVVLLLLLLLVIVIDVYDVGCNASASAPASIGAAPTASSGEARSYPRRWDEFELPLLKKLELLVVRKAQCDAIPTPFVARADDGLHAAIVTAYAMVREAVEPRAMATPSAAAAAAAVAPACMCAARHTTTRRRLHTLGWELLPLPLLLLPPLPLLLLLLPLLPLRLPLLLPLPLLQLRRLVLKIASQLVERDRPRRRTCRMLRGHAPARMPSRGGWGRVGTGGCGWGRVAASLGHEDDRARRAVPVPVRDSPSKAYTKRVVAAVAAVT
jgi:hypothetical protein